MKYKNEIICIIFLCRGLSKIAESYWGRMLQSCIISQMFHIGSYCNSWDSPEVSAGDFWVSSVLIDWVRLRVILPQIAQITQRNAAKLYYFAEKDRLVRFAVLSFWISSAIISVICGRHWGFFCANWLSTVACYSHADSADYADEYSKAALFRRERQVGVVYVFCG